MLQGLIWLCFTYGVAGTALLCRVWPRVSVRAPACAIANTARVKSHIITSLPFSKWRPKSGFDVCLSIGCQHLWCPGVPIKIRLPSRVKRFKARVIHLLYVQGRGIAGTTSSWRCCGTPQIRHRGQAPIETHIRISHLFVPQWSFISVQLWYETAHLSPESPCHVVV